LNDKSKPVLECKNIVKKFPGVLALKGINVDLHAGEVHVLFGAKGAGKSTLRSTRRSMII